MDTTDKVQPPGLFANRMHAERSATRRGHVAVVLFYLVSFPVLTQSIYFGYEYLGMTEWLPMVGLTAAFVLYCGWKYAFFLLPARLLSIYVGLGQEMDILLNLVLVGATAAIYAGLGYLVEKSLDNPSRKGNLPRYMQLVVLAGVGLIAVPGPIYAVLERSGYHFFHTGMDFILFTLMGGFSGFLHVAPFMITIVFPAIECMFRKPPGLWLQVREELRRIADFPARRKLTILLELGVNLIILGAALQPSLSESLFGNHGLIYFSFLPVIWVGLNYSFHMTISTVFFLDTLIILGAAFADYDFFGPYELQILVISISLVGYILALVMNDQRQLVTLLEEEEDKYRSVIQQTADGIVLIDRQGIVLEWNDGMEAITGIPGTDAVGQSSIAIIPGLEDAADCLTDQAGESVESEENADHSDPNGSYNICLSDTDGITHEVHVNSSLVQTAAGCFTVLVVRDFTEEQRMQRELAASEERFRSTVAFAHDGIALIDEGGLVVEWNQGIERVTAVRREAALGQPLLEIVKDLQIISGEGKKFDLAQLSIPRLIDECSSEPVVNVIHQIVHPDGKRYYVKYHVFTISTSASVLLCIIASDVTALMEREIDLEALNSIMASVAQPLDLEKLMHILKERMSCYRDMRGGLIISANPLEHGLDETLSWGLDRDACMIIGDAVGREWETIQKASEPFTIELEKSLELDTDGVPSRRLVVVPLRSGERLMGVAAAVHRRREVEPGKVLFLSSLGQQVGTALQNAFLVGELRKSRERLRKLTGQIVRAQEAERRRVSRELHDEAGQALTALKIGLELLQSELDLELEDARERLEEAVTLADSTMEQIRLLARDLRPPGLEALGLSQSLENMCNEFEQRTGLNTQYSGSNMELISDSVAISLYRFLQEALTNVARHAYANSVWVKLDKKGDSILLEVEDDGCGFDVQAALDDSVPSEKIGLAGMGERLELIGGKMWITSSPSKGTQLAAEIPWRQPWSVS